MPVLVVMGGLVASLLGIFSIKALKAFGPQSALRYSTFISGGILIVFTYIIGAALGMPTGVFWAVTSGLVAGVLIGLLAEYYTSGKPVRDIAESTKTGPATVIISGMAWALIGLPVGICAVRWVAYLGAGTAGRDLRDRDARHGGRDHDSGRVRPHRR
jgi:K(+)-stimulated pyrophosphate-energized sodium pump